MVTGIFDIDGVSYFANESGVIVANRWINENGSLYYAKADRSLQQFNGKMLDDGSILLFDESGAVVEGWCNVGKHSFYADPLNGGKLAKGWILLDGKWYWADDHCFVQTGWKQIGGYWFWLNPNKKGEMATGWQKIGGNWYYLNSNGSMATGWLNDNGWYYLLSDGSMATGWHVINGRWEEFDSSGRWIDPSSALTRSAQSIWSATPWLLVVDTSNCYVGVFYGSQYNWQLQHFWYCAPGKPSTPTVKGQFTVGNKGYYFDSYGVRCFYWTQFYGNYLFHSVLYAQTSSPQYISDGRTGMQLSHGCVRLDLDNAYWIYANIPRGTKVYVF